MTQLSSALLELSRVHPQQTKLHMSIFQPVAIFKARINSVPITRGARVIPFDTVTLGSYTDIQAGQTLWVGNTNGAQDVGKIRVRSATSTEITVSENSNINWEDNLFLTVAKYWELWPIFPRIIQDPSDEENVIFYKDYDVEYTNQNSILGSFVCAGPHRASYLDVASGQSRHYYSASGTYNLLDLSLSYHWTFEGGSPSTSNAETPGYVTYNTPGHYVTSLIVSGSNGAVDSTYRYVSIYNQANPAIQKWEMTSLAGSRDEGGYSASFRVLEDIPIQEHAVVIIFGENWYGTTKQNLGGNAENSGDIFWVGHIDTDSIHYDYLHSEVNFTAHSVTGMMKESSGFSVSVESKASPTKWFELVDMDCRRAIYHYLRWHTTALSISDFQFVGTDAKIQFFDSDRESMYDAIDNLMRSTLIGKVVSDRQGKIWIETDAVTYTSPLVAFPSIMDITNRDWINEPVIEERLSEAVSFIEMGGIAYTGNASGTFAALLGSAPGNAPGFHGSIETHEGLALINQEQLNRLVGNVFANKNSPFPSIEMEMANNVSFLDIAPQEGLRVAIAAGDTVRGVEIDSLYLPNNMNWTYSAQDFILLAGMGLRELVSGEEGETITVSPPTEIGPGFNQPPIEIPPIPPLTVPTYALPTGTLGQIIYNFQADYGKYTVVENAVKSSFRTVILQAVSLSSSLSTVQFTIPSAGVYYVAGYVTQTAFGGTAGGRILGRLLLSTSQSATASSWGPYLSIASPSSATALVHVSLATLMVFGPADSITLTYNGSILEGGGTLQTPQDLGLSVIRVSA